MNQIASIRSLLSARASQIKINGEPNHIDTSASLRPGQSNLDKWQTKSHRYVRSSPCSANQIWINGSGGASVADDGAGGDASRDGEQGCEADENGGVIAAKVVDSRQRAGSMWSCSWHGSEWSRMS